MSELQVGDKVETGMRSVAVSKVIKIQQMSLYCVSKEHSGSSLAKYILKMVIMLQLRQSGNIWFAMVTNKYFQWTSEIMLLLDYYFSSGKSLAITEYSTLLNDSISLYHALNYLLKSFTSWKSCIQWSANIYEDTIQYYDQVQGNHHLI